MKNIIRMILVTLFLVSCGTDKVPLRSSNSADLQEQSNRSVEPPRGYFDASLNNHLYNLSQSYEMESESYLYLNFEGDFVKKGFNLGESFLLCSPEASIAGSTISSSDQDDILRLVATHFSQSNPDLVVSNVRPVHGNYTTIIVAESPADIGCSSSYGITSLAPLDRGDVNSNDIAFVFTESISSSKSIAKAIVESGNQAFGYSNNQGLSSGTQNLAVPGIPVINGYAKLLTEVDEESSIDVSNLLQQIDQVFPGGLGGIPGGVDSLTNLPTIGGLQGIDQVIGIFSIATGAAPKSKGFDLNLDKLDLNKVIKVVGGVIALAAEMSAGGLTSLLDIASLGTIVDAFELIQDVLFGGSSSAFELYPVDQLPDFSLLLGLEQYSDVPSLIQGMRAHAAVVDNQYQGDVASKLKTLMKVAYAQAYKKL